MRTAIERMDALVLSTAHVSRTEAAALDTFDPSDESAPPTLPLALQVYVEMRGRYGWLLRVERDGDDVSLDPALDQQWPGLVALRTLAREHDVRWLRLDADGEQLAGLPRFDW